MVVVVPTIFEPIAQVQSVRQHSLTLTIRSLRGDNAAYASLLTGWGVRLFKKGDGHLKLKRKAPHPQLQITKKGADAG
jgi:hypothetical protein